MIWFFFLIYKKIKKRIPFLVCRFDIGRYHAFQHPLPTPRAAWVAIPLALFIFVLAKIRNR